jgi:hypothetical protein
MEITWILSFQSDENFWEGKKFISFREPKVQFCVR